MSTVDTHAMMSKMTSPTGEAHLWDRYREHVVESLHKDLMKEADERLRRAAVEAVQGLEGQLKAHFEHHMLKDIMRLSIDINVEVKP